jgi:hypothetical protein
MQTCSKFKIYGIKDLDSNTPGTITPPTQSNNHGGLGGMLNIETLALVLCQLTQQALGLSPLD